MRRRSSSPPSQAYRASRPRLRILLRAQARGEGKFVCMKNSLDDDIRSHGGLLRSSRLRELGHSRHVIDAAIADGWLLRPCRSWLATAEATRDSVVAALHRGVLTGSTSLRSLGIWSGTDNRVHVLVAPNARSAPMASAVPLAGFAPTLSFGGVIRHWRVGLGIGGAGPEWRGSAVDSLRDFASDQSSEYVQAAIESALNNRVLATWHLAILSSHLPVRHRHVVANVNARAEAGTETLARLRIESLGCRVEAQMWIGSHRVDLLVDGWLVVEIDSEAWHGGERLEDSRRNNWLTGHGYRVLRFDYAEVMHGWDACERAVLEQLTTRPARPPQVVARQDRS